MFALSLAQLNIKAEKQLCFGHRKAPPKMQMQLRKTCLLRSFEFKYLLFCFKEDNTSEPSGLLLRFKPRTLPVEKNDKFKMSGAYEFSELFWHSN